MNYNGMDIGEVAKKLSENFGEKIEYRLNSPHTTITQLLTDSRNIFNPEDTLFFAINTIGGNDGHNYMKFLYDKGVRNFVAEVLPEDLKLKEDLNIILVSDTVRALSEIGSWKREKAKEVVAIVGSRGKTTLKEMLFELLEPSFRISRSPRSYNSKIGVPLSLWQIQDQTDIALIEAGISRLGEMYPLAQIIDPDTVIFNNIGDSHSEGFQSMQQKADEKALIASSLKNQTLIYPFDNEFIKKAVDKYQKDKTLLRWSTINHNAELFIETSDSSNGKTKIEYVWQNRKYSMEVSFNKEYDFENFAAALAFLLKEGISHEEIKERFNRLHRINTRLNVSDGVNGCTIIKDSYTSDLSSLLPAIDFMMRRKIPSQTPTLIISDLHHEGEDVEKTYKEISGIINQSGIKKFIGIGSSMIKHRELFPQNSFFYVDTESFLENMSASDFNDEIILLKGSGEFGFERIYEVLEIKKHETVMEINLDSILKNYNYFRKHVPSQTGIIAMVKASGYGSGSYEIAKTLQDAGASYLAVAALDEGIELRRKGITMPVMVMNPRSANYKSLFRNKLEPVIYTLSMVEKLIDEAKKNDIGEYPVHIKLDTGMHRMGFEAHEIDNLIDFLYSTRNIRVTSVFSHLATADCPDMDEFTFRQLTKFEDMSNRLINGLGYPVKRHILNSAGILRFPQYHFDFVRLGIGLYGANTLPQEMEEPLAVVSTLRSVIICIREIEPDEAVGYGRRGVVNKKSRIATIPIGYADGMNRKFGNGALKVLVNGKAVPTIGNICMDATMLDVTDVACKEGDSVEIFGDNISLNSLAELLDTIPYEILTSVSPRVKRIYFRE